MTQLLQIIRILCNKVLEKPTNATVVAKACLEIHHNQQSNVKHLGEHKFRFLESLANCLRECSMKEINFVHYRRCAKMDRLYTFLMEIYINLKETYGKCLNSRNCSRSETSDDDDDDDDDDDGEDDDDDVDDDENDVNVDDENDENTNPNSGSNGPDKRKNLRSMNENTIINDLNHADSSSCQSVSSDRSVRKNSETGNTSSVESRIQLSLLSKQQKNSPI
ncbi:hypothetical protein SSS_10035 [Sarcoptes scabiei]|nr:hypothetical protein SSS_10035 [Sarcoptes scabiei]